MQNKRHEKRAPEWDSETIAASTLIQHAFLFFSLKERQVQVNEDFVVVVVDTCPRFLFLPCAWFGHKQHKTW